MIQDSELKIRWAPKVRQEKIWRLYQDDARGIVDEALIDDVGWALYLRCQSVVLASSGRMRCPRCGHIFAGVGKGVPSQHGVIQCPECCWETTDEQYYRSRRHRDLIGTNAGGAFETYIEQYPKGTSPRARLLLIDRLIHAFHQSIKNSVPHRSAANNLIEGSHKQVVALLDRLAYGDASTTGTREAYAEWRGKMQQMQQIRTNVEPPGTPRSVEPPRTSRAPRSLA